MTVPVIVLTQKWNEKKLEIFLSIFLMKFSVYFFSLVSCPPVTMRSIHVDPNLKFNTWNEATTY